MEVFEENPFSHWTKPLSPVFNKICYKIFSERKGFHKLNSVVTTVKQIYGYTDYVTRDLTKFLKERICEHFGLFTLLIDEFHQEKVYKFLFDLKKRNYINLYTCYEDIINYLGRNYFLKLLSN